MRLAFIHPSFALYGGAENYLLALMQGLAQRGHHIDLYTATYDEQLFPPKSQVAFQVIELGGRGYMEGIGGTWRLSKVVAAAMQNYDLAIPVNFPAHIWTAFRKHDVPMVWLCMEPKRNLYSKVMYAEAPHIEAWGYRTPSDYKGFSGKMRLLTHDPHVLLPYSWRSSLQRGLDKYAVGKMTHILTHSPYTAEKIQQIYPQKSVEVIWAGVEVPHLATQHEPFILVPTRLEKIKNVDVVLQAVKYLKEQQALEDYQVVIMGTGTEKETLQTLSQKLGIEDVVSFVGFVSNEERDNYYDRCAMVVYPSLAEPLGMPCIEAGLRGKAVIASHQGGPATIIQPDETGLLVNMNDSQALAQAVIHLIQNPEKTLSLGSIARQQLEPIFGLENWLNSVEKILAKLA